jgi:Zn-dependent protease with chaperone function
MRRIIYIVLVLSLGLLAAKGAKKLPKPGFNLFSQDQDVQMGKEYAQQIEQQMVVINNKQLTDYINRVGQRLVNQGGLREYGDYPYNFKVVQEDSINAFALPGGPMYVHTGLIAAAENEGQLAGVLAHELSHVALRHGTNQASKQQMIQLPAMLAGAVAGGSLTGQLAQLGIGLGMNSVLMKFSRGAESDSDLLGMHAMARAGYNPIDMARFFEKLEAEMGGDPGKVAQFFSSHPNPGNRVKAIEEQIQFLPRQSVRSPEGDIEQMRKIVGGLPKQPKTKPGQPGGGGAAPAPVKAQSQPKITQSGRMKAFQARGLQFEYPEGWEPIGKEQSGLTIAPPEGIVQGQGASAIGYGIIISQAQAQRKIDLQNDTGLLLQNLAKGNAGMKMESEPQQITVGGARALVTRLSSDSPYPNTREANVVVTVDRGNSLFYMIFVAPLNDYQRWEPAFQNVVRSVKFQ